MIVMYGVAGKLLYAVAQCPSSHWVSIQVIRFGVYGGREGTDRSMIAPKKIMYSCRGRMLTMVAYHSAVEQSGNATEYSNQMFEGYNICKNVNTVTTSKVEELNVRCERLRQRHVAASWT